MSDLIEHKDLAISRLATQYRESPNLIAYIRALFVEADNLEEVFQSLLTERWIDTAVGVNLDILGAIVGQPRVLVDATILSYFGFSPDPGASSYGTVTDPSIGGRFRAIDESTTGNRRLTDDEYRFFIRARIVKNSITPTIQSLVDFFKLLFDAPEILISEGNTFYQVAIGKLLTANEKAFITSTDIIPKVAGVGVGYINYTADEAFSFSGIPTGLGFGTVADPSVGGTFASVI